MNSYNQEILKFKCPRWSELPEIDLYMDQVVNLIDKKLSVFADENEKIVTSTMINNYVKQKIISPPEKKKYDKNHIAHLFIIILLKKAFSVSEISAFLNYFDQKGDIKKSFNDFGKQIEHSLSLLFDDSTSHIKPSSEDKITETFAFAFACKLYAKALLKGNNVSNEKEAPVKGENKNE